MPEYSKMMSTSLSTLRRRGSSRSVVGAVSVDDVGEGTSSLELTRPNLARSVPTHRPSTTMTPTMSVASFSPPSSPFLPPTLRSYSSFESFHSLALDKEPIDPNDVPVKEDGLRHAEMNLNAKQYKHFTFAANLVLIISLLKITPWQTARPILPDDIQIHKVSGSLTNAVFFVSYPGLRTLLLRIYGPSSGALISRPRELHTLHVLSSTYHFGPRVYGTFENGRIEEYFESNPLTATTMRDRVMSEYIATRMAELHGVDIASVEGGDWDIGVRKNIRSWITPARHVLTLVDQKTRDFFDIENFVRVWEAYWNWIRRWESEYGESARVFAHNDAQYGNLLQLAHPSPSRPPHQQIIVVDFEYAAPNPAAFDIANHFHEWTANYHSQKPWFLDPSLYPSHTERRVFYRAYLRALQSCNESIEVSEEALRLLDLQVRAWSPASHAMWAIWGLVQAREELETKEPAEFDYINYAQCRMESFMKEAARLQLS